MITRRYLAAALSALPCMLLAHPGSAQRTVSDSEATAAVMSWLDALASGDPARLETVLAPEFQLIRGDRGYTRAEYLKAIAKLAPGYEVTGLVATSDGDSLVARYVLTADVTAEGRKLEPSAPRLTVFRRAQGRWLVVAHANSAQPQ